MLGFLHTAATHVPAFEELARALAPELSTRHAVAADLLAAASAAGAVDTALASRVTAAVEAVRAGGARVVVCTCSTIGDAAEAAGRPDAPVLRIDRPMAEAAVRHGGRVAVVAALDTALAATIALLERVAAAEGRPVSLRAVPCPQAWPSFERGDLAGYRAAVATAARAAAETADVVLLAQASMAGALPRLADLPLPIWASPELGVRAAIARWRALG